MESTETKTQVDKHEIKTEKTFDEVNDINANDDLTSELNRTLAAAATITNNGCSNNISNVNIDGDETKAGGGARTITESDGSVCGYSVTVVAAQLAEDEKDEERTRDDKQNEQCQQQQKCKTDKIREVVEQATSEDSKKKIDGILSEVQQLSDLEKLLLYLRLPAGTTVEVDPLKQAFISSLGNRFEVTQTVTWIQTHLEEDPEVSLPKQEVYDGYSEFCQRVKMKPLSTADFGKVMKQVFAGVRPRRLGTRGNSRYCYAGLRKKLLLDSPKLPDLSLTHEESFEDDDPIDPELTGVSSHLVREWAEKLLGQKFSNLRGLACHLVENAYVNNRSVAAFSLLSYLSSVGLGNQSCLLKNQCTSNKHRETQLQLQRKLHEREQIREQKKKLSEQRNQVGRKEGNENPSSKSGRKSHLAKTQNENLRMLLSTSSSVSVAESETHESNLDSELRVGEKLKPSSSSLSTAASVCVPRSRRISGARSGTPISFYQKSVGSSAASRRRSGGGEILVSTVDARRPKSSLENGSNSSRPVQSSENTSRANRHSSAPQTSVTDLSCSSSEPNKAGKVLIPRMKSGQSPKMCLPPTSIIFFPQISGTLTPSMSEYNNNINSGGAGNKLKPKYKPIQPKPVSRSSSSDDGRTVGEVTDAEIGGGGVLNEDRNGREGACCVTPAGSQLSVSEGFSSDLASSSSLAQHESSILHDTVTANDSVVGKAKCPSVDNGNRSHGKGGRRKYKRGMESKEGFSGKKKRPCLQTTECSESDTTLKFPVCSQIKSTDGEMSISTLENDAWMEYLGGVAAPHAEQEEELLQYFEDDVRSIPSSSSRPSSPKRPSHLSDTSLQSTELSQLRRLLERNLQKASLLQTGGGILGGDVKEETIVTTSGPSSADTMPTLRLLLSDRKQQQQQSAIHEGDGMISDTCLSHASSRIQSPITTMGTNSPQVVTPATAIQHQQHGQNKNPDEANVSLVEKETSLVYEAEMSHQDVWSQEDFGMVVKPLRVPDEHMFSSDSSSGCHIGPLFQNNEGEMVNSRAIHFDDRILMGEDERHSESQQMTPDFRPYNGTGSYTVVPSYASNIGCGQSSVPPSPNTRRRAFNFMPISPRNTPVPETCSTTHSASHSPLFFATNAPSNGGGANHAMSTARSMALAAHSQSVSATTSPFVSPRSTPSSHCRSRHNSGQASSSTYGTPRATPHPIYTMEQQMSCLSSPFASPHPTPVHFSRSRHNSSQNVPRSGLIYSSAGSVSAVAARSRHASDLGMAMMSPGSAPMSPLELGIIGGGGGGGGSGGGGGICETDSMGNFMTSGHFTLPSLGDTPHMRSRHNSNSSVPPNSPRSAPMSPMVSHCSLNPIQDVNSSSDQTVPYGKPTLGSSPLPLPPPAQRQFQLMTDEDHQSKLGQDLQWQMMQDHKYQHGVLSRDLSRNPPSLQQSSSWPTGVPQRHHHAQIDPRLASRQRHASMGATVHHHPNPIHISHAVNPPLMIPTETTTHTTVTRVAKKPPPLPILNAIAANRCRSVPIYQMLENAIQQSEQIDSPYNDVMMSRSYPATPIGQHTFSFDGSSGMGPPPMCLSYSPMVGGGCSNSGKNEQPPSQQQHAYNGEQVRNLSESLDLPQDQFQDMLQTTLDDLSYVDDISKIAQELEQYTSSTQS